ncbi:hypothetical protein [Parasitella parasitica]|uniref:Uncharacterized protein n=1 Tax=Parasitella parasitica TaxID=35722 RepID=A0A0B7NPG9_9FUNG|nr:hypothetical protein [Parasitella parasitica]
MLSNNHSFRKLNLLGGKRSKVEPITNNSVSNSGKNGNISIDDLAFLVKRLSVQIDDLGKDSAIKKQTSEPLQPPLPQQDHHHHTNRDAAKRPPTHSIIDPWASYVPQNYGALLQRLEDIESLQKCPNECCASTGTVSSADGVPWPNPLEPFQTSASSFMGSSQQSLNETLDIQYTHWCTLMRCLPLMDPVTCAHVKTVGLYAMREILKLKANQRRDFSDHYQHKQQQICCNSAAATTTRLRESLSYLGDKVNDVPTAASTTTPANQDIPAWMSTSETKTAISETVSSIPPAVPPKETEATTTPTPSGFSSPTLLSGKRFQKWIKYKKTQRKANTDTASTPMIQSQTIRKIGSWFF